MERRFIATLERHSRGVWWPGRDGKRYLKVKMFTTDPWPWFAASRMIEDALQIPPVLDQFKAGVLRYEAEKAGR